MQVIIIFAIFGGIGIFIMLIGSILGFIDIINSDNSLGCSKTLFFSIHFFNYLFGFDNNPNYKFQNIVRKLTIIGILIFIIAAIIATIIDKILN